MRNDDLSAGGLEAADLRPASVGSSEVVDDSLSGADVNEATLELPAETWHEVGAVGEPAFHNNGSCTWENFNAKRFSSWRLPSRSLRLRAPEGPGSGRR